MLSKRAIRELIETTRTHPGGFVVFEENEPKFVIVDFETYQKLSGSKAVSKSLPKKTNKILVTGGAGYIGSHTARLLIQRGYEVVTFDNLSTGREEFAQGEFIEGDLADRTMLEQLFSEHLFDAVLHFAAFIQVGESTQKPFAYYRNNFHNSLNLLEAMAEHNVLKLIFSSSSAVYAESAQSPIGEDAKIEPESPYGETKAAFERALLWAQKAYGISSVSLRYFNAAGASFDQSLGLANQKSSLLIPNAFNVALGKQEQLIVFGNDYETHDGTAIRDYIHVLDVAEAQVLALEFLARQSEPVSEAVNIGTGKGYSVLEVVNQVCESTGKMIKFEVGPRRKGDRAKIFADIKKARTMLGFEPKFSDLKTIIDTHWAFHKRRFG